MKKKETKRESEMTISVFEKHQDFMAQQFKKVFEKLSNYETILNLILKQMQVFIEEGREHRKAMSSLMRNDIGYEKDIEDLKIRVGRLETQIK